MKPVRISLPSWRLLLALLIEYAAGIGAPAQVLSYLQDRLLHKADAGWSGFDNGWSEEDFDEWDKRVTEYVKAVPKGTYAKVALVALEAARKMEVDGHEASCSSLRELLDQFKPFEETVSNFGLLCAKNDALGSVLHAMTCFNKRILASRIDFDAAGVSALANTAITAAAFHTSNRLAAEYFSYMVVLQQIKKQPAHLLAQLPNEMKRLASAVAALPFDDAASQRQRQAQAKVAQEIVHIAVRG